MSSSVIDEQHVGLRPRRIEVGAGAENLPWEDISMLLGGAFPFKLGAADRSTAQFAGKVNIEDEQSLRAPASDTGVSSFYLPQRREMPRGGGLTDIALHFANNQEVPLPFRGRSLRTKVAEVPTVLRLRAGECPLAFHEGKPVWAKARRGGISHFRSGFALPESAASSDVVDLFNGERFMEMLPLVHWLRGISGLAEVDGPSLRACFIFDDPNLHWPSYGFVDYREIAERAARENYHVSFATIPLDTWYAHPGTVAIFRRHPEYLSLCVHGNDHTKAELAGKLSQQERRAMLNQALRRMERFERKTGLRVCRVMVPPHGACSEAMLGDLPHCGFEAACISHGSLRAHNRGLPWTRRIGLLPSEVIHGCPVLPRWAVTGHTPNAILLAAYLRQPLILRAHHQDLKGGIELLDQLAGFINGLGNVRWARLTDLSRGNFQLEFADGNCRIRTYSRKLSVAVPKRATSLVIDGGADCGWENWSVSGGGSVGFLTQTGEPVFFCEGLGGNISIEVTPTEPACVPCCPRRSSPTAVLRRLLTESRDRLKLV